MSEQGVVMVNCVMSHMALSRYVLASLSVMSPGFHRSMCIIENGLSSGQECINSEAV